MKESLSHHLERRFTRREFMASAISLSAVGGLILRSESFQNSTREISERFNNSSHSFPQEYLSGAVERISPEDVKSLLTSKRIVEELKIQDPQEARDIAQVEIEVPPGKIMELTLQGIKEESSSVSVLRIDAQKQRRYAAVISSKEPQDTKVLLGPFRDEKITLRLGNRSMTGEPIKIDQIKGEISHYEGDGIENLVLETAPEILPRFEHRYDLTQEPPYKSYAVVYKAGNGFGIQHFSRFLWEKGGTRAEKLYSDTRPDAASPGRTDDVEWVTMSLPYRVYIQTPHHVPVIYRGELLGGTKPIAVTKSENNNFRVGNRYELEQGSFSPSPEILSPDEFDEKVNRPDRMAQLLSFKGLIRQGLLPEDSEIILDFLTHNPDLTLDD